METFNVRIASINDIDGIYDVEKECFENSWSYGALKDDFLSPGAIYVIAELESQIVGFCAANVVLNEAEIRNFAVKEHFRRQGIADAILKRLFELLNSKKVGSVFLEVRKSNASAQSLYRKKGFTLISIRREYYSDNLEDAFIMLKEINK